MNDKKLARKKKCKIGRKFENLKMRKIENLELSARSLTRQNFPYDYYRALNTILTAVCLWPKVTIEQNKFYFFCSSRDNNIRIHCTPF